MSPNAKNHCITKLVLIGEQFKDNDLVERASQVCPDNCLSILSI